jgi:hypothetical protein
VPGAFEGVAAKFVFWVDGHMEQRLSAAGLTGEAAALREVLILF